jgi:hypothetical protein
VGLDVCPEYLEQCASLVSCNTYLCSILEADLKTKVNRCFRYVLAGAVLHHIVGKSRKESLTYKRQALMNLWNLVEPGGTLIINEPTFSPKWFTSLLFYIKLLFAQITNERITILGYILGDTVKIMIAQYVEAGSVEVLEHTVNGLEV